MFGEVVAVNRERCRIETQIFSRQNSIAMVLVTGAAVCVPALQPILLSPLLAAGKISPAAMGYAATAEGLGMALASAIAGAWFRPSRLRAIGVAAIMTVLFASVMTIFLSHGGVVAARGLSGLGNGVLVWILVGMLARSADPTRLFATFVTSNATMVFLLSMAFTKIAIPYFGPLASYNILMAIYAILLLFVRFLPDEYTDADKGERGVVIPPPWGFLALGAVVLQMAGVMSFWVYAVLLGKQAGLSVHMMQSILNIAIGIQILAGPSAIFMASRLSGMQAIAISAVVALLACAGSAFSGDSVVWAMALVALAFCWLFGNPFHISFLIGADPSRRSALFVSAAQLGGVAAGPLLASTVISATDYRPVHIVSVVCFILVLAITAVIAVRNRMLAHH